MASRRLVPHWGISICLTKITGNMSENTIKKNVCNLVVSMFIVQLTVFLGCHEAYYKSKSDHSVYNPLTNNRVSFLADEVMQVEVSYKVSRPRALRFAVYSWESFGQYSEADAYRLFAEAELRPIQRWMDKTSRYSLWLLERPPFMFPLLSSPSTSVLSGDLVPKLSYSSSPFGVPTIEDWQ